MIKLTLIGCEHSYFTGKARGYLRWKGVPFAEVLSTLEVYGTVILPQVGWAVIPVLKIEGEVGAAPRYVQDTSDIIDEVERLFPGLFPVRPACPRLRALCAVVELLVGALELQAKQALAQHRDARAGPVDRRAGRGQGVGRSPSTDQCQEQQRIHRKLICVAPRSGGGALGSELLPVVLVQLAELMQGRIDLKGLLS